MSNLITSSATTKVYVAVGQTPATYDAAGFAALTYSILPDITNIGQLGGTTQVINHIPVDDAIVYKVSGSQDSGTLDLQGARTTAPALDDLRLAYKTRAQTPFKIVYPAALGETDYFMAIVTSVQTNVGTADQILGFNTTVNISGDIITV